MTLHHLTHTPTGPLTCDLSLVDLPLEITAGEPGTVVLAAETADDVEPPQVEFTGDLLTVRQTAPRDLGSRLRGIAGGVRLFAQRSARTGEWLRLSVPPGTDVSVQSRVGNVTIRGEIGAVRADIDAGRLDLECAGDLDATVDVGDARIGTLRRGRVRTNVGAVRIGLLDGECELRSATGSVTVDRAVRGRLEVRTDIGSIRVGVPDGTLARLDCVSDVGSVRTDLEATDDAADGSGAGATDGTDSDRLEVRARSSVGSIRVRRPLPD